LLRFKEDQLVMIDIHNDTDTPELVHWHGQMIPSDVDGAAEEGSPLVPAHGTRRISLVPKPHRWDYTLFGKADAAPGASRTIWAAGVRSRKTPSFRSPAVAVDLDLFLLELPLDPAIAWLVRHD
jgi:Multicopper oxidase